MRRMRWQLVVLNSTRMARDQLGHTTDVGIGINTGNAHVGNVGFQRYPRYAPFGNTVNLASRVQGATKYLGVKVIATASAFRQSRTKLPSRDCAACA